MSSSPSLRLQPFLTDPPTLEEAIEIVRLAMPRLWPDAGHVTIVAEVGRDGLPDLVIPVPARDART